LNDYGFLYSAPAASPVTVLLHASGDELVLARSFGLEERVRFRDLYRLSDEGQGLRLGRRRSRNWQLHLTGETADAMRERVPRRWRRIRWGAARAWHIGIFVATVLLIELVKMPADLLAPAVPRFLEGRLAPADVRSYGSYCNSREGEQAIRRLIARFDPALARRVRIQVLNESAFVMAALPGERLVVYLPFLNEIDANQFAALLAHEVAHLQNRHTVEAGLRAMGTFGALIGNAAKGQYANGLLHYSRHQEAVADDQALKMLLAAKISPLPGVELFKRMEDARRKNEAFGKEHYYLHFGFHPDRAERWRDYPQQHMLSDVGNAMSSSDEDALFNYCWRTKGPPRIPYPAPRTPPSETTRK
jgi:Zn-dependent protease with chaperone function